MVLQHKVHTKKSRYMTKVIATVSGLVSIIQLFKAIKKATYGFKINRSLFS